MSTTTAGPGRIGWALADSWTMTRRELAHWARQPVQVVVGLVFPVMLLLMFNYLVGGGRGVDGDNTEFLVPGMLALLQSVAALAVMTGVGYALGWRWHNGTAAALGALGLLLLLRFAMLWIGIQLAMVAGRPEMVQAVQILVWPVGFLSNVFASPESMPGPLGAAVEWNPMSATATAVRGLFGNPGGTSGSWAAEHAELLAVLWPVALIAVFFPLAVRRFARLSR
ncbi:ABC transporter permease [Streptomyces sp. wa22]|uniref:ABC transporter permease n=1 Tax=Streptomyces sp. wa22 TaxID=1828244 RepID=UPI0011C8F9F1|nr:ABC transporter permease [Streptomyces sp. wa22]TXS17313.1 ABC transporter permease [Streptomyces sp. wa22]